MDPASGIGIPVAFGAGLISFLSPCVLPLVPGYISAVAGVTPGEIRATRVQDRNHAERIARNSPIQGTAADLLKLAMIRVDAGMRTDWPGARLLLTVHDELVFEVEEASVASFSAWVKAEMEAVYGLRVPLVVDVGAGPTWGSAH